MLAVSIKGLCVSVLNSRGITGVLGVIPFLNDILSFLKCLPPRKIILENISFDISKGECFGIIGFNGSGKTTICSVIANLIPYESGSVIINGKATLCTNDLHETFTALENIQMGTRFFDLCPQTVDTVARNLLGKLGVTSEDLNTEATNLSFGTRSKVALVRAVIISLRDNEDSPIIILDEPTRGFDVKAVREFKDCVMRLRELVPDLTIIIATNQESELCLCDRYTALVNNKQIQDEGKLLQLRDMHEAYVDNSSGLFESMISGEENSSVGEGVAKTEVLVKIPMVSGLENPFFWRARREIITNPSLTIILLFTMIIPNLFPLLNAQSKEWKIFAASACGIYFTFIMRTFYRVIARESGYYKCLSLIMQSKYRGLKHLFAATRSGILQDTVFAIFAVCVLALTLALQIGLPDIRQLSLIASFQFLILFGSCILFSQAVGIILSPLMKSMKGDNAFLLLSVVPFLVLMISGLYYGTDNQMLGFGYFAQLMPYTMLGEHLRTGGSMQSTVIGVILAFSWYGISLLLYQFSLKVLFLAKRLKD